MKTGISLLVVTFLLTSCDFSPNALFGGGTDDYESESTYIDPEEYDEGVCYMRFASEDDRGCAIPDTSWIKFTYTDTSLDEAVLEFKAKEGKNLQIGGLYYRVTKGGEELRLSCKSSVDDSEKQICKIDHEDLKGVPRRTGGESKKSIVSRIKIVNAECGSSATYETERLSECNRVFWVNLANHDLWPIWVKDRGNYK